MAGPSHVVVLLDGLVERGLAEEQEAQANPHGQQPGHGGTGACGGSWGGGGDGQRAVLRHVYPSHTHTNPPSSEGLAG